MDFRIISDKILDDETRRLHLEINRSELMYLVYFLESFEGWCNCTTVDKKKHILQIDVTESYEKKVRELLGYLRKYKLKK